MTTLPSEGVKRDPWKHRVVTNAPWRNQEKNIAKEAALDLHLEGRDQVCLGPIQKDMQRLFPSRVLHLPMP